MIEMSQIDTNVICQKTTQEWDGVGNRVRLNVAEGGYGSDRTFEYNAVNRMSSCEVKDTDVSTLYAYRKDGTLSGRKNGPLNKWVEFARLRDLPKKVSYLFEEEEIFKENMGWNVLSKLGVHYDKGEEKDKNLHFYNYDKRGRCIARNTYDDPDTQTGIDYYVYNKLDTLVSLATHEEEIGETLRTVLKLYGHQVLEEGEFERNRTDLGDVADSHVCPSQDVFDLSVDIEPLIEEFIEEYATCPLIEPTRSYAYDEVGNVSSIHDLKTGSDKKLTWNAWGQLIRVEEGDLIWEAVYDGLGRRLLVRTNSDQGDEKTEIKSFFDPEVEFIEIGLEHNGHKVWKVYGPDLSGDYGTFQGVGGLEALVDGATGESLSMISDIFGHVIGHIDGETAVWKPGTVDPYGAVDWKYLEGEGTASEDFLRDVARSIYWRSRRSGSTGLVLLGARYYDPSSSRFISPRSLWTYR